MNRYQINQRMDKYTTYEGEEGERCVIEVWDTTTGENVYEDRSEGYDPVEVRLRAVAWIRNQEKKGQV